MGYIGNPAVQGNFSIIDDISGSFNGSDTQFTIAVGGTTQTIGSLASLMIHINGVYQVPGTAFTAGSTSGTIAFTGPPANGATFSGQIFGDTLDIGTPSDATVTAAKLTSIQGAYRNVQTLTGGLSIAASENASIVGPITVSSGQTINVASGGTLVIL
jgi:hypothetical protein|tara:strand:+ start:1469 stop:1942 length:474 start_codon:yes stop_codon:yes gene_type:complete